MRGQRRLIAALALMLLCAPGTWLRSPEPPPMDATTTISIIQLAGVRAAPESGWEVAGVWQFSAPSLRFGGFSALLALPGHRLRAFSDRGARFTFVEPDSSAQPLDGTAVQRQWPDPAYLQDLSDIESATADPASGVYWLGYENTHAIHRFSPRNAADGLRDLTDEVDWYENGGAEAMVRLADGRFLLLPEGRDEALVFDSDPLKAGAPQTLIFDNPAPGYVATDIKQLPDGRLLVLMRRLAWGYPPFAGLLAIGELPPVGSNAPWRPEIALRLDEIVPRENYEGLAVCAEGDGRLAIWVISDDNFSVMQRSLLVKLRFDPRVDRD